MKYLFLILLLSCSKNNSPLVNGKPIECRFEAYNCPSYRGTYQNKRLKSCEDVKKVWEFCKTDVHGLDRDGDGPCDNDCNI